MTHLLGAILFLTRVPIPGASTAAMPTMGKSMRWFPVVGLAIGALAALADAVLSSLVSSEVRAVLIVALLAAVTGGLHLDGLMDSCDGLLAFTTRERRLEIMRDSRVGSFAVVGLTTALLLKYAALLSIPDTVRAPAFLAMGGLSRWAMVLATVSSPVARQDGLLRAYKEHAGRFELLIATVFAVLALLPLHVAGVGAILVAVAITALVTRYAIGKIGGLTGDVCGAICEAVEIAVAIAVPPLVRGIL